MDSPELSLSDESLLEHATWVRKLAFELVRDPGTADDLAQETWLAFLRARPDTERPLRPWLARVLRNAAALIHAYGEVNPQQSTLVLQLEEAPPFELGVFLHGSEATQTPFGSAFLCVGGQIGRSRVIQLDSNGQAQLNLDFGELSGETKSWTFQAVFRDTAAGGFRSSDSVTVAVAR